MSCSFSAALVKMLTKGYNGGADLAQAGAGGAVAPVGGADPAPPVPNPLVTQPFGSGPAGGPLSGSFPHVGVSAVRWPVASSQCDCPRSSQGASFMFSRPGIRMSMCGLRTLDSMLRSMWLRAVWPGRGVSTLCLCGCHCHMPIWCCCCRWP